MSAAENADAVEAVARALRAGATPAQAARLAGVGRRTVYRWRDVHPAVQAAWGERGGGRSDGGERQPGDMLTGQELDRLEGVALRALEDVAERGAAETARVAAARELLSYAERRRAALVPAADETPSGSAPAPAAPTLRVLSAADAEARLAAAAL